MIDLIMAFACGVYIGGFAMTLIIAAIVLDRR